MNICKNKKIQIYIETELYSDQNQIIKKQHRFTLIQTFILLQIYDLIKITISEEKEKSF